MGSRDQLFRKWRTLVCCTLIFGARPNVFLSLKFARQSKGASAPHSPKYLVCLCSHGRQLCVPWLRRHTMQICENLPRKYWLPWPPLHGQLPRADCYSFGRTFFYLQDALARGSACGPACGLLLARRFGTFFRLRSRNLSLANRLLFFLRLFS